MKILAAIIAFLFFTSTVYAGDICFSKEEAKQIVVELEQKRILEQENQQLQLLVDNLKKQNELLKQQNDLLKDQLEIYKGIVDTQKKELAKEKFKMFGASVESFIVGGLIGVIGLLLILK
jgi:hypothetical protein